MVHHGRQEVATDGVFAYSLKALSTSPLPLAPLKIVRNTSPLTHSRQDHRASYQQVQAAHESRESFVQEEESSALPAPGDGVHWVGLQPYAVSQHDHNHSTPLKDGRKQRKLHDLVTRELQVVRSIAEVPFYMRNCLPIFAELAAQLESATAPRWREIRGGWPR